MLKVQPNLRWEKRLWRLGYRMVAGADEVGSGALAGPVVAGAAVWPAPLNSKFKMQPFGFAQGENAKLQLKIKNEGIKIDDSKRLSPRKREEASKWIKSNALAWGVGEASVATINRLGIAKATKIAFRKAIKMLNDKCKMKNGKSADFLLIDAFYVPYTKGLRRKSQLAIIKGDEKSVSIAAASIIAKVYRDKIMRRLSRRHRVYGWGRNKGYGTREHQEAIKKCGITRLHRRDFVSRLLGN